MAVDIGGLRPAPSKETPRASGSSDTDHCRPKQSGGWVSGARARTLSYTSRLASRSASWAGRSPGCSRLGALYRSSTDDGISLRSKLWLGRTTPSAGLTRPSPRGFLPDSHQNGTGKKLPIPWAAFRSGLCQIRRDSSRTEADSWRRGSRGASRAPVARLGFASCRSRVNMEILSRPAAAWRRPGRRPHAAPRGPGTDTRPSAATRPHAAERPHAPHTRPIAPPFFAPPG